MIRKIVLFAGFCLLLLTPMIVDRAKLEYAKAFGPCIRIKNESGTEVKDVTVIINGGLNIPLGVMAKEETKQVVPLYWNLQHDDEVKISFTDGEGNQQSWDAGKVNLYVIDPIVHLMVNIEADFSVFHREFIVCNHATFSF